MRVLACLLCVFCGISSAIQVFAREAKSVTLTVSEKSVNDALALALRMAAKKYLNFDPLIQKAILDKEVIPRSAQYISTYKVVGNNAGNVSVSATIDLNALQSVLVLSGPQFKKSPVKILLIVKGFKGGAPWSGTSYEEAEEILVSKIEAEMRSRAQHRKLQFMPRLNSYQEYVDNLDIHSASMMRAIAMRVDADLVIFVNTEFVQSNDDESIIEGLQLQLETALYEKTKNLILATSKYSIPMMAGERALVSKNEKVLESVVDLIDRSINDVFMRGGVRMLSENTSDSYITLRVKDPPNHAAIQELKESVRKIAKVNGIVEREIQRGAFDFWVDTAHSLDSFRKELKVLSLENYRLVILQTSEDGGADKVIISLENKAKSNGSSH